MVYVHKETGVKAYLNLKNKKIYIHGCSVGVERHFIEDSAMWETLNDKVYHILTFKLNGRIFHYTNDGKYWSDEGTWANFVGTLGDEILSVVRTSDGEIYSVGDRVKSSLNPNPAYITKLRPTEKTIFVTTQGYIWGAFLDTLSPVIKPLFKTQDGRGIFPGDSYWCVNTAPHLWSLFEQTARERTMLNKGVLAFKSFELAEEYIEENKPLYSLKDMVRIADHWSHIKGCVNKSKILKTVAKWQEEKK